MAPSESGRSSQDRQIGRRGRISDLMQRLFYPDEHQQERLMMDLLEDMQLSKRPEDLCRSFGEGLHSALAPSALHLFVRRSKRLNLGWSSSRPLTPRTLIPADFKLPDQIRNWNEPRAFESLPALLSTERQWLRSWDTKWLAPICTEGSGRRLVGFLCVGDREAGLTAVQRDLLMSLCRRMAGCWDALIKEMMARLRSEQGQGKWLKECPECQRCFGREVFFCPDDDAVTEPTVLLDRLVDKRYFLEQKLGRGGMGAVYRATDQQTGESVALKVLTGGDRTALGRFANEARVGKTMDHPSITQVLGSGTLGRQGAYMAMEYVQGKTLRRILDEEAPIPPSRVAHWFDQILGGVADAHRQGIIHRDLKPDNIMVTEPDDDGEKVKLLDFGLAKLRDDGTHSALTAAGMVIGTLSYMSPEQLAADKIDHRTDIFALGAILSEALTGRLPFFAPNLGQMLQAVATQPYSIEVHTVAQARVAHILGKALAKAPDARYSKVEELRRDLIPALEACEPF